MLEYLRVLLKDKMADRAKSILIKLGVVECDNQFIRGEKAFGYRLNPAWRRPHHLIEIPDPELVEIVEKRHHKLIRRPVCRWIEKNLGRVSFAPISGEEMRSIADPVRLQTKAKIEERMAAYRQQMDLFLADPTIWEIDEFGKRVHHGLCSIKKEIRKRGLVDGQSLAEIDVRCCQPVMLAIVCQERGIEAGEYAKACEDDLYKYVGERAGLSRNEAKDVIIKQLFYDRECWNKAVDRVFAAEFPEVHAFIMNTKKKDWKKLCRLLQKRESKIVVHTVCERFRQERPEMFCVPIYDSVMVLPADVSYAVDVLRDEFQRLGVAPGLTITHY